MVSESSTLGDRFDRLREWTARLAIFNLIIKEDIEAILHYSLAPSI